MSKRLTVTIVIPVYNEAAYIEPLLQSLQAQTRQADEIIIVDNNSTDDTVQRAKSFSGVKVIQAKKQGNVFARNVGFDAAHSDIIFKLDADSRPHPQWIELYVNRLTQTNSVAISGRIKPYDGALRNVVMIMFNFLLFPVNRFFIGGNALFGSNYGIKRDIWNKVKDATRADAHIWEDIDLALVLHAQKYQVEIVQDVLVEVSVRSGDVSFLESVRGLSWWPITYWRYNKIAAFCLCFVALFSLLFTIITRPFIRRGYYPPRI